MTGFFSTYRNFWAVHTIEKMATVSESRGSALSIEIRFIIPGTGWTQPCENEGWLTEKRVSKYNRNFFLSFSFFCWGGVDFIHSCWGLQQGSVPFVAQIEAGAMYIRKAVELVVMPLAAGRHIVQWLGEQRQTQMMLSLNHQGSDQREPLVFNLLSMLHNPQVISSPNFLMTKY